jgi:hypothetical protein
MDLLIGRIPAWQQPTCLALIPLRSVSQIRELRPGMAPMLPVFFSVNTTDLFWALHLVVGVWSFRSSEMDLIILLLLVRSLTWRERSHRPLRAGRTSLTSAAAKSPLPGRLSRSSPGSCRSVSSRECSSWQRQAMKAAIACTCPAGCLPCWQWERWTHMASHWHSATGAKATRSRASWLRAKTSWGQAPAAQSKPAAAPAMPLRLSLALRLF